MSERFDDAIKSVPTVLREALFRVPREKKSEIFEIRLRAGVPVILVGASGSEFLNKSGRTSFAYSDGAVTASRADIDEMFLRLCEYSVHSFEKDIAEGFLTGRSGHRAGICGKISRHGDGTMHGFTEITSINLRIAREFKGAAKVICEKVFRDSLCSAVIAGPPVSGKTTVLRDIARSLSEGLFGEYYKVSVIDGRKELSLGGTALPYCDVYSGFDRAHGINCAIRSMSPQMVICDELSSAEEAKAVSEGFASGTEFSLSVHASDINDLIKRPVFKEIAKTGQFRYTVMLKGNPPCSVGGIYKTEELIL